MSGDSRVGLPRTKSTDRRSGGGRWRWRQRGLAAAACLLFCRRKISACKPLALPAPRECLFLFEISKTNSRNEAYFFGAALSDPSTRGHQSPQACRGPGLLFKHLSRTWSVFVLFRHRRFVGDFSFLFEKASLNRLQTKSTPGRL